MHHPRTYATFRSKQSYRPLSSKFSWILNIICFYYSFNKKVKDVKISLANESLKMLLVSKAFDTVLDGFISFNAENLGSVGQRA